MTILPVNNFILNSVTCVLYSEDVDYCILIDCGEYETLKPVLDRINKKVKAVLLTNGHSFNYLSSTYKCNFLGADNKQ
ncbi:MBL fold metallo-hydrolase [Phocaeicola dorei]|uniref:MBL fold metallo-hydrolase n=1 Tax=Phocaeicola dorei TaxID=357276 RepID=UPI002166723A|nr:MBL fold metallo-hydrolase [Phocaeicola dorei]MCS2239995.1 MBL fold metallo-hydrolase [Phocaeicola dorei]